MHNAAKIMDAATSAKVNSGNYPLFTERVLGLINHKC